MKHCWELVMASKQCICTRRFKCYVCENCGFAFTHYLEDGYFLENALIAKKVPKRCQKKLSRSLLRDAEIFKAKMLEGIGLHG